MDSLGGGAYAVHAAYSLHEARGVPGAVVIDDDIGAVQVDALGKHVAGDNDVVVVALCAAIVGVEVGADQVALAAAVAGAHGQDVVACQAGLELAGQVVHGVHALAEDHQLAAGVALWGKQLALQHLDE